MRDLWGIGGFRGGGEQIVTKKIERKISIANLEKKRKNQEKKFRLEMV